MPSPPAPTEHIDGTLTAGPGGTALLARLVEQGFVLRGPWFVHAHVAARPGTGQGRDLRALVGPARRHAEELPGLVDVGAGVPQGGRLRREPRTT